MAEVNIDFNTNLKSAQKEFQTFEKTATKSVEGISSAFKSLAGVAAAAVTAIGTKKLVDAAVVQEKAVQTLNTALALNGELTEENTQRFLDFTSALQGNSTVGDEVSLTLIGLAKSFGATNDQVETILQGAADLAAITGQDLETSVRQISQTLGGFKGRIAQLIPDVNQLTVDQLKAGAAVDLVAEKFAGAAKALTKTFGGAATQASNAFGDVLEDLGEYIIDNPTFVGALNLLTQAFSNMSGVIEDNKQGFIDFVNDGLSLILDAIPTLVRLTGAVVIGFESLKLVIDGTIVGFAGLAEAAVNAANIIIDTFAQIGATAILPLTESLALVAKGLNAVGGISDETLAQIEGVSQSVRDTALEGVGALDEQVAAVEEFRKAAVDGFGESVQSIRNTADSFENTALKSEQLKGALKLAAAEVEASGDALNKLSEANKKAAEEQSKQAKITEQQKKENEALKKELQGVQGALQKAADAADPIGAAQRVFDARSQIVEKNLQRELISEEKAAEIRSQLRAQFDKETNDIIQKQNDERIKAETEAEKKAQQERLKLVQEGLQSPLVTRTQAESITGGPADLSAQQAGGIAQGVGALGSVLQGAQGAANAISQAGGLIADTLLPGIGGAVTGILGVLSQGPEAVEELVKSFISAIPDVVVNIAKAIPVLITTLAENIDEVIVALVKATPDIIKALVFAIPEVIQALQQSFIDLVSELLTSLGEELGFQFDLNFEKGADDLGESISQSLSDGGDSISEGFNSFFVGLDEQLFQPIGSIFSDAGDTIALRFSETFDGLGASLQSGADSFAEGFNEFFVGLDQQLFQPIGDIFSSAGDTIANAGTSIGNGLQTAGETIVDFFVSAGETIGRELGKLGDVIVDGFAAAGSGLINIFSNAGTQIFQGINRGAGVIEDNIRNAFNSSIEFLKNAFNGLLGFGEQIGDFVKGGFIAAIGVLENVFNGFVEAFEFVADGFSSVVVSIRDFFTDFVDSIKDALDIDLPSFGGGGGGGSFLDSLNPFQTGGEVPPGFPNDTFPAALTSGENVLTSDLSDKLESFIDSQAQGSGGQQVQVVLQVGEKQLADVLLDIDRQGFRTA